VRLTKTCNTISSGRKSQSTAEPFSPVNKIEVLEGVGVDSAEVAGAGGA
jgi:hypothetical protein